MSDSTQNPPPEERPATPPPGPPPPPPGQGSYQPGAAPPPMQAASGIGQPAALWPRFFARGIDFILLAVVNAFIVGFIIVGVVMGSTATGAGFGVGSNFAASAISSILSAAIALGYFSFMESSTGQTLGKMVLKLETRGPDGGHPTLEQAMRRNAWTAIGVIGVLPIIGGVLSGILSLVAVITIAVTISNNTATRQGWHDDFAGGTTVVKIG